MPTGQQQTFPCLVDSGHHNARATWVVERNILLRSGFSRKGMQSQGRQFGHVALATWTASRFGYDCSGHTDVIMVWAWMPWPTDEARETPSIPTTIFPAQNSE